jgi:hypothetical protein
MAAVAWERLRLRMTGDGGAPQAIILQAALAARDSVLAASPSRSSLRRLRPAR